MPISISELRRKLRKLLRLVSKRRYRRALRLGVAAAIEHEAVAFNHSFRTIFDVGSHRGQFALFARERFPAAKLYCVEPQPEERRLLERAVEGDVSILPMAAGATTGQMPLHISRASDSSSLLPISDKQTTAFPGTEHVGTVMVDVRPLDDLVDVEAVQRPALLKIDVQGGEGDVLQGAKRLLTVTDEAYIECSFVDLYRGQPLAHEIIQLMHSSGFHLTGAYGLAYDSAGHTLQADLLFSRVGHA